VILSHLIVNPGTQLTAESATPLLHSSPHKSLEKRLTNTLHNTLQSCAWMEKNCFHHPGRAARCITDATSRESSSCLEQRR